MKPNRREPIMRRILVALDATPHSQAALEAAAELAASLGAELVGVYVEDVNLLRLAQLPFARETRFPAAATARLELPEVEQRLREQARRAQAELARLAERKALRYSFQVRRGQVGNTLIEFEADLLVLGRVSHALTGAARLGSTARTALVSSGQAVLLTDQSTLQGGPITLLFDGSAAAERALAVAEVLAEPAGPLHLLLWCGGERSAGQLQTQVRELLSTASRVEVTYHAVTEANLLPVLLGETAGLLILADPGGKVTDEELELLLNRLDRPVLILR